MKFLVFLTICSSSFSVLVYCERRIFGGNLASLGQFPYQVSLQYNGRGICTGTIIDERWVITAAHCVQQSGAQNHNFTIRAGFVAKSLGEGQIAEAEQIIVHSDYTSQISKQDLALVKVREPFNFNGSVGKISLSDEPWPAANGGRTCTIAGFGLTEHKTSNELRYLQVKAFHGKNRCPCIVKNFQLKRLICLAPEIRQGACFGDSGGGIICDGKVVGIAHMVMDRRSCKYFETPERNFDCGSENVYAMYMYVCPILDWIKKHVPSTPATPQSCNARIITPSLTILFLCLYILKIVCF